MCEVLKCVSLDHNVHIAFIQGTKGVNINAVHSDLPLIVQFLSIQCSMVSIHCMDCFGCSILSLGVTNLDAFCVLNKDNEPMWTFGMCSLEVKLTILTLKHIYVTF